MLKVYTRKSIENILDANRLQSIYWREEPLNAKPLSRVTGMNISLAETGFNLEGQKLIEDIFVSCSADRDRSYTLTVNLELNNPFKSIDLTLAGQTNSPKEGETSSGSPVVGGKESELLEESSLFRIYLPQSTFLVQLNQRIRYDECLDVKYVQLGPNVNYDVECLGCSDRQRAHLDRIFRKKMSQFDAELDSLLSEKLLLGLQILSNQKRLDLDLYLE